MSRTSKYYKPVDRLARPGIKVEVPEQEFFTMDEIADLVGCTKGNLSNAYRNGKFMELDARKSGKFLYKRESLLKWLETYRPNNDPKRRSNKAKLSDFTQLSLLEVNADEEKA